MDIRPRNCRPKLVSEVPGIERQAVLRAVRFARGRVERQIFGSAWEPLCCVFLRVGPVLVFVLGPTSSLLLATGFVTGLLHFRRAMCAGPPILARAFSGPKYVGVTDVIVLFSGSIEKTWRPHAWWKITTIPLPKHCSKNVRPAVVHVISLAQYAPVYSRRARRNRPSEIYRSTAMIRAVEPDITCKFGQSDYNRC